MIKQFKSLYDLFETFPTEQTCIDHMKSIRWREGEFCPYCNHDKIYHFSNGKTLKCAACKKRFSIRVGTIFEDSKISLRKWFAAIYLITQHSKGISSVQLAKDIGVTQKTGWFMLHRLRYAAKTKSFAAPLKDTVEVDETYIGGKEKNKHTSKRTPGTQGRNTKTKTPVLGMLERKGNVRVVNLNSLKAKEIEKHILDHVAIGSRVLTDEFRSYLNLAYLYQHESISHANGEYVRGDVHTNSIEGFWALLKRGIIGIYHFVSVKHLERYLDEFSFRYNLREEKNGVAFNHLLHQVEGRLTYKALIDEQEA